MADDAGRAALLAVEVLVWQLVTTGALGAASLAAELERYANMGEDTRHQLMVLAQLARAAAPA